MNQPTAEISFERKLSLTKKIMIAFLIPISIGMLGTGLFFFFNLRQEKEHQNTMLIRLVNENMLERITRFQSEVELLALNQAVTSLDYRQAEPFLNDFIKKNGEIWSHFLITDYTGYNVAHTDGQKSRGVSIADRTYFTVPWNQEKTEIAEPNFSKSTGRRILAIGVPLYDKGVKTGVLVGFVRLEYISWLLNEFTLTKHSYNLMINKSGVIAAHPNPDIVLLQNWINPPETDEASKTAVAGMSTAFKTALRQAAAGQTGNVTAFVDGKPCRVSFFPAGFSNLSIISISPLAEIYELLISLLGALVFIFILLVIVSVILGKAIVRPIKTITGALPEIAQGDFTKELKISAADETGELSFYFNETLSKIRDSIQAVKNEIAIMENVGSSLAANAAQTASAVHAISANIENIKTQVVNESAGVIETQATIEQIAGNIEKLNADIETQAHKIADSTAATEEMIANIRSVSDILDKNTAEMNNLGVAAEKGRESLEQSTLITEKIESESDGLLEASSIIQQIASQTNLLAMNAAIEAAHAGDAGRGFAVVADEIRKLSENASAQSKSITQVLKQLKTDIEQLIKSSNYVQEQFSSIFGLTKNVQEQGSAISGMMREQAVANEQVLLSMQQIAGITGGVQQGSALMLQGSREISIEMQKIADITTMINNGMVEMSGGTQEITLATQDVSEISRQNSDSIGKVRDTINLFKV